MKTFLFVIVFCPMIIGQTLAIYSGVTFPVSIFKNENSNPLSKMWHPGISLGIDYRHDLSRTISISSYCLSEVYFFNDKSNITSPLPEVKLSKVKGNNSYLIKVGFNLFYQPKKFPLPQGYIFTGLNYSTENFGQVTLTWYLDNVEHSIEKMNFKTERYFAHILGLGAYIVKIQSFDLFIELKTTTNYSNRFYFSLNLGASFVL